MTASKVIRASVVWGIVIVCGLWIIFPIFWTFSVSLKNSEQLFTLPPTYIPNPPTLQNYADAISSRGILPALRNSLIVMVVSAPISVLFASLAAYGLARFQFRGKRLLLYGILSIRMLPGLILAIPMFLVFRPLGLQDTLLGLIIIYTAFNMPFNIWLLTGFFEEIPREIEEAGLIDGCNPWQLYRRIILPLATPALVASLIFCMLLAWNEFQFALILTRTDASRTLPVVISGMTSDRGTYFGQMGATGVLAILPVLAVAIYVQRYLVKGLTAGAVKG
ncbi:MAG: carbohydrate ABC transporter permease [Anaerolineae bacterium]|nr:carbohydrate ABC transporter permease [Anaerolineae bacterium]